VAALINTTGAQQIRVPTGINRNVKLYFMKQAFTLIELMVVIAIIALLLAIMVPALAIAHEQAKVVAVNCELRQIALTLVMYMDDNNSKPPPTRTDCNLGWEDHQLPPELVTRGYLPPPPPGQNMSTGMEDRFHPDHTYRYWSVGELYQNSQYMRNKSSRLWVPSGFPLLQSDQGCWETDPKTSPVTWVIYSQGPKFDSWKMKQAKYPVPTNTWYNPQTRTGVITRIRLLNGKHVGSFER